MIQAIVPELIHNPQHLPALVSHWLGHASINTTNRYTAIDLEMKREAISRAEPPAMHPQMPAAWRHDHSILEWLESL